MLDTATVTEFIADAKNKVDPRLSDAAGAALMNG
jgi:hypothetical protein